MKTIKGVTWYPSKCVGTFMKHNGETEWFPMFHWKDCIHFARFVHSYNLDYNGNAYGIWLKEYVDTDVIPYQFIGDHNEYRKDSCVVLRDEFGGEWRFNEKENLHRWAN